MAPKVKKNRLKKYRERIPGSHSDPCVICGADATSIDHIHPKSKGGSINDIYNWTPMCHTCNQDKGTQTLLIWMLEKRKRKKKKCKDFIFLESLTSRENF